MLCTSGHYSFDEATLTVKSLNALVFSLISGSFPGAEQRRRPDAGGEEDIAGCGETSWARR